MNPIGFTPKAALLTGAHSVTGLAASRHQALPLPCHVADEDHVAATTP